MQLLEFFLFLRRLSNNTRVIDSNCKYQLVEKIPVCWRRRAFFEDHLCALEEIEVDFDNARQVESTPLVSPPQ